MHSIAGHWSAQVKYFSAVTALKARLVWLVKGGVSKEVATHHAKVPIFRGEVAIGIHRSTVECPIRSGDRVVRLPKVIQRRLPILYCIHQLEAGPKVIAVKVHSLATSTPALPWPIPFMASSILYMSK